MLINPGRVDKILSDSFYKDDEVIDGKPIIPCVKIEGVTITLGLHPERLASHRDEVASMISNLPSEIDSIKGLSFLKVCQDKDQNLWTGLHKTCDALIILAIGLDLIEYVLPRSLWVLCPGSVPMIRIKHPSDPNNKDMFKYRNGRERSKVVQTWLKSYKNPFMKGLVGEQTPSDGIARSLVWGFNLQNESEIASVVTNYTVSWLDSDNGRRFLQEVFDVDIKLVEVPVELSENGKKMFKEILGKDAETSVRSKIAKVWNDEYRETVLTNVIFRVDNSEELISKSVYEAVNYGSNETAEIVADTVIGWLNSGVGRSFVRDAFEVEIPSVDLEGSE